MPKITSHSKDDYKTITKKRRVSPYASIPYTKNVIPKQMSGMQALIGKATNRETKCRDQIFTPNAQIATGAINNLVYVEPTLAGLGLATGYTCLNTLAVGSGVSNRVGSKITITSLRIKGCVAIADNADVTDNGHFRCCVVLDHQCNGAAPAYTEVFEDIDANGGVTSNFNSGIKIANKKRFVMLRDDVVSLSYIGPACYHYDHYIKKRIETEYKGSAIPPPITDITTNSILLFIFVSTGFTHNCIINDWSCRMRYID